MIKLRNLIAMLCIFGATACTENNISFDEVVNVPEGIYLSGSSSEFSVPIEKGRLTTLTSDNYAEHSCLVEERRPLHHLLCW